MSNDDAAARWACLSLDLTELLQASTRLRDIAKEYVEDRTGLTIAIALPAASLKSQPFASSTLSN
jgi:hypothetical protein